MGLPADRQRVSDKSERRRIPPPIFYMLAFSIWIPAAVIVWLAAILMLFSERLRHLAGPLALAMTATFPGVLLFQAATIPVVILAERGGYLFWRLIEPGLPDATRNPAVFADFILTGLVTFGLMGAMSIAGFYEGWRVGWWCGQGQLMRDVIRRGPTARLIGFVTRRWRKPAQPQSAKAGGSGRT